MFYDHAFVLGSIALLAGACGPSTPARLSPPLHECTPYQATTSTGTLTGAYAMPSDKQQLIITAPADPGGGYFGLELTAAASDLVPGFTVTAKGDTSGAIIAASANGTNDPSTMRGGFSAAPGQAYVISVNQGVNSAGAYPIDFSLTWTFTGAMDCYEANNAAGSAKQVPVGTKIEAYAFAGYITNYLTAPRYDDWYRLVLERPATVEAELSVAPGNHRMRICSWEADGTTQRSCAGGNAGGETFTLQDTFAAGTYLLSVEVAAAESATWHGDDTQPTFWTSPYTVQLREAP